MLARDIEMFIEHCGLKGLSTKTINSYEQTLRLFMQYTDEQGILLTEKITHLAIQSYIKSIKERGKYTVTTNLNSGNYPDRRVDFGKRVSDVTINNYLRNLRVFFNWCVEEELILRSPVKKGDFVKVERKPLEFVSDEDFKRLLKSMNSASFSEYRDSIIIQLLLDTGMRVNECLLIEVTDLDMVKRCISLPADNTKGKKARYVFFSDKMATQLQRWIKYKDRYRDSDFLFCTNKGKRIQVSNFEANVRKYAKRIGLSDIHPHVFRNNFAKRFLMSGGDIYTLSRLLGHSSVTVTEQAYGYIPEKNEKKGGHWTATGAQFQVPYVFKTLFSHEDIVFDDLCETKSVSKGAIYLDKNEALPEDEHNYIFVGRVGQFCPIKPGCGGALLMREAGVRDDGETKYNSVTGAKDYRWLESEMVYNLHLEDSIDRSYFDKMVDEAADTIAQYGDLEWFVSDDGGIPPWQKPDLPWGDIQDEAARNYEVR